MMYNMPTSPFTMKLLPPMGEENAELMRRMREYALSRYGRPRAEVEKEIDERLGANEIKKAPAPAAAPAAAPMGAAPAATPKPAPTMARPTATPADLLSGVPATPSAPAKPKSFLDKWMERKAKAAEAKAAAPVPSVLDEDDGTVLEPLKKPEPKVEVKPEPKSEPEKELAPKAKVEPVVEPVSKPEKKLAEKPKEDLTAIKIPKSPKPKAPAKPEPAPEPEPEEPKSNTTSIAGGGQVVQNDDGATLRWR
jgi:translation initiation factor IF-2